MGLPDRRLPRERHVPRDDLRSRTRSHTLLGLLAKPCLKEACFAQCTVTGAGTATCAGTMDGLDAGQVKHIGDAVNTFCSEMAK